MATRPHPLAASAGISICASLLVAALIPAGGLAFVLVAAALGFVAAFLARSAWVDRGRSDDGITVALVDMAGLALVAGFIGPLMAVSPVLGLTIAGMWALGSLTAGRTGAVLAAAILLGVAACGQAALGWPVSTALLPTLAEPTGWPRAVTLGVLLAGLGAVGWARLPRRPGEGDTPWATVGAGLLASLAVSAAVAGRYAATEGEEAGLSYPLVLAFGGAGLVSWMANAPASSRLRASLGLAATGWVAAATHFGGVDLAYGLLDVVLPATLALVLGRRALQTTGTQRVLGGALAALLVGGALASARWPETVATSVGLSGWIVAMFWSTMARRSATTLRQVAR